MKKKMIIAILTFVLAFSLAGAGWAAPPPLIEQPMIGKAQIACPVRGNKIDKDVYVDYNGQRVYFCCPVCIDIFKKDPEAYLKKMQEQGIIPEKSPGGK